jgi:hypothetical protein
MSITINGMNIVRASRRCKWKSYSCLSSLNWWFNRLIQHFIDLFLPVLVIRDLRPQCL